MGIEIVQVPYEILFRLNENGLVAGCHCRSMEIIRDDITGVRYNTKELDPQPITGELMDDILGTINTALTTTLVERDAQVGQLSNALSGAQSSAGHLATENALLFDQLNTANARISELEALHAGAE